MRTTTRRTDGDRRPPRRAFRWFPGRRDHDRGHRRTPVVGRLGRTRHARDLRADGDISAGAGQRGRGRGLRPRRAGAGERHGARADPPVAELMAATSLVCRPTLSVDEPWSGDQRPSLPGAVGTGVATATPSAHRRPDVHQVDDRRHHRDDAEQAQAAEEHRDRGHHYPCLLYTSDAADEEDSVDLGGRRIIKKKKNKKKKEDETTNE